MFLYNGVNYMCEPIEIVTRLHDQCLMNGRDILRNIKQTSNAIMFTCPWHKDGQERKPSCGLIIRQKTKDSMPIGKVHCFTCLTTTSLEEFISNCFGINDGGKYGGKWLTANFIQMDFGGRPKLDLSMISRETHIEQQTYVSEQELDTYRYIHPYMYQRRLTDDIINKFDIGYDRFFKLSPTSFPMECITFPVRDINGNCLFVARRAIYSKMFNYPDSAIKPLYGIYELSQYAPKDLDEIYVCESILDCTTLWTIGKYAIALNGLGSESQLKEINKLKYRKIILATDMDEQGLSARQKIKKSIYGKFVYQIFLPQGIKDINECPEEYLRNMQPEMM